MELPLWLAPAAQLAGLLTVANTRALDAGLRLRPLDETVRDVRADYRQRPEPRGPNAGLQPQRERTLLAALTGEGNA